MTENITANNGLTIEEPLIFEQGDKSKTAIDIKSFPDVKDCCDSFLRKDELGLSGLSEPEVIRHYTRLSQKNYGIDTGFYPLGSCTMKYNPRVNEKMARLCGFADVHPFQPEITVQGALEAIYELGNWLKELTGMAEVAMTPAAGAHGELCGMMAIKAYHDYKKDENRKIVLVPDSAHGTNPATAALCGYAVENIKSLANGKLDVSLIKERLAGSKGKDVAALMLTNPNTCGLFENNIIEISKAIHDAGALFYLDGANFNAVMGRVKIADLGADAMHINLHKTFSTPHGGGGPGSGPTVFSEKLAPFAPLPKVIKSGEHYHLIEDDETNRSFGRMRSFHGQFGVIVRALSYVKTMGIDGLKQASGDAVLNANYILHSLKDVFSAFVKDGYCMHEALFDDESLKDTGVTTLDIAKALLDEGYHPMTMYFPLVVHGAMLIEPTETESKKTLDEFIDVMKKLHQKAKDGDAEFFKQAPRKTPRRRLDETLAARSPELTFCPCLEAE
ncbi:MAG: aminomethyl-transferring glycine dehydrogenase subunit GcvPB [Alphaproteobacteria bacterium]